MYDFRPRDVNPEQYDQKMQFWKNMIINYCGLNQLLFSIIQYFDLENILEYKGSPIVSIVELKSVFKRNGTSPRCLQDVFNSMAAESDLQSKVEFMNTPKGWAGWAKSVLVVKPLSWGFGVIKDKLVGTATAEDSEFVVQSAVVNQSRQLMKHIRNNYVGEKIISMDQLMSDADNIGGVSREGMFVILHYMSSVEKSVYVEENINASTEANHHHKLLLKFADPHKKVEPITEMERAIHNLEQTEKFLQATIEEKEQKLNDALAQVKLSLSQGKKLLAKSQLRKKHLLETDLTKTLNVLDNVQTMLERVKSSEGDKEILSTYKIGSDAIKSVFVENGINVDNVHDIIEDMQEIYANQEEFESAISEPMRRPNDVDDSALEKELMDLLNEKDIDKKTNNIGGGTTKTDIKTDEMDLLDRELEMRLRRLRSNLSDVDEPAQPEKKPARIGF